MIQDKITETTESVLVLISSLKMANLFAIIAVTQVTCKKSVAQESVQKSHVSNQTEQPTFQ